MSSSKAEAEEDEPNNLAMSNSSSSDSDGEFSDPLCVDAADANHNDEPERTTPATDEAHNVMSSLVGSDVTPKRLWQSVKQFLAFYVRFGGSAGNQDKLLKVLQWSLWLLANTGGRHNHQTQSGRWMGRISDEVSWARYVTRLLGLPVALEAAVSDSWTLDDKKSNNRIVYKVIGKILAYSMVAYHPTEMLAYLQWKKPAAAAATNGSSKGRRRVVTPERWSCLSCRFWLAYTAAELAQCVLRWRELRARRLRLEQAKKNDDDADDDVGSSSLRGLDAQLADVRLQTARDALFLLPCVHWSLPRWDTKPWLRPATVSALMWAEAVVSLYQAVRNQQRTS